MNYENHTILIKNILRKIELYLKIYKISFLPFVYFQLQKAQGLENKNFTFSESEETFFHRK